MREIKFRAWNPISNAMFWSERCKNLSFFFDYMGGIDLADGFALMQYTGLKDKNGKEAYHKDILKDDVLGELWLIEWSDEYACFELQRITENTVKIKGILETISACRIVDLGGVIGNIYENKELLNGN